MTDRPGEFSWGGLFRGIARMMGVRKGPGPDRDASIALMDDWTTADPGRPPDPLELRLREIERDALSTYEAHGLPTRPGHYARAPGDREWQFVAEILEPDERWALVHEYPPSEGWRFATLQALGDYEPEGSPNILAARLLQACATLRNDPQARLGATIPLLDQSIQLGSDWQAIRDALAATAQSVKVVKPGPLARRNKADREL